MSELVEFGAKIALSALLGGAVGAEREWTGKWAGFRTHMLIAVGAALLTDLSIDIGPRFAAGSNAWDPGRIAAQIVSGIGFLGAGAIIQARGTVRGLTTAAGMWVGAAIGMAVGARFYAEAVVATVALLMILAAFRPVEERFLRGKIRLVVFRVPEASRLEELVDLIEAGPIESPTIHVERRAGDLLVHVRFTASSSRDQERFVDLAHQQGFEFHEQS